MSVLTGRKKSNIVKDWRQRPKSIEKFQFVHHFLPHPEDKKRATLLSNKAIIVYCAAMLLIAGIFRFLPKVVPGVLGYASDISVKDLLTYTNMKRKEAGFSELRLNSSLTSAAYQKAEDMFKDQYWAHISPAGTEPWDFILGQNYDYIYAGENLAKNFKNSKDVVEAWMKSSSHRENLLSPNYDEIGFAVVNGVMEGYETLWSCNSSADQGTPPRWPPFMKNRQSWKKNLQELRQYPRGRGNPRPKAPRSLYKNRYTRRHLLRNPSLT